MILAYQVCASIQNAGRRCVLGSNCRTQPFATSSNAPDLRIPRQRTFSYIAYTFLFIQPKPSQSNAGQARNQTCAIHVPGHRTQPVPNFQILSGYMRGKRSRLFSLQWHPTGLSCWEMPARRKPSRCSNFLPIDFSGKFP
jgi:hypothetical protein